MFCIVLLLLYWIQNLIGENWAWLGFSTPLLKSIVSIAQNISDKSVSFWGTTLEFKYLIAVILLSIISYVLLLVNRIIALFKEAYNESRRQIKKMQENTFNNNLERSVKNMQKKIDRYQIYITTQPKKELAGQNTEINLSEENKKMNKFLIEKTGIVPAVVRNGFVYSFNNFEQIDVVLEKFFKLLNSQSPLNYYICVYLLDSDKVKNQYNLEKLTGLNIKNKIITMADLVLRYSYNPTKKYDLSVVGVFQKGDEAFEVHQFKERNET